MVSGFNNNLPFLSNRDRFKGREDLLALLDRQQTSTLSQPETLWGMGGIGKTQLALEYA